MSDETEERRALGVEMKADGGIKERRRGEMKEWETQMKRLKQCSEDRRCFDVWRLERCELLWYMGRNTW